MSDERLAILETSLRGIDQKLGDLCQKLDALLEDRLDGKVQVEKLKMQVRILMWAVGVIALGGGGVAGLLKLV